ncbi:hypothetical protein [Sphingobacterium spiritivorum]|uniref:hypothetical protein n=1 Tax=Sphingobacterium spiritivorum TaxID=258 RepID=UPI00191926F0|nr:hypothetical protein [Sphingobacterium spiritivorum]QQT24502.1 hypothetical protein I6J02_12120 [Sphingobacterium spiritivorum]
MSSTNPITLNYLVFDDDPDASSQYIKNVSLSGHETKLIFINPTEFFNADKNVFEEDKFLERINEAVKGININLIISDWNILPSNQDYKGLVGWDVLEYIIKAKEKLKSRTFLIYSADIKKASQYILKKITSEIEANPEDPIPSLDFVSKILELKIKFCKRDDNRFNEIATLLKESNTISNIVLNSILSFDQNTIINTGNDQFDGKKITDILNGPAPDNGGLKFIREFIELSIANYSELNAN